MPSCCSELKLSRFAKKYFMYQWKPLPFTCMVSRKGKPASFNNKPCHGQGSVLRKVWSLGPLHSLLLGYSMVPVWTHSFCTSGGAHRPAVPPAPWVLGSRKHRPPCPDTPTHGHSLRGGERARQGWSAEERLFWEGLRFHSFWRPCLISVSAPNASAAAQFISQWHRVPSLRREKYE